MLSIMRKNYLHTKAHHFFFRKSILFFILILTTHQVFAHIHTVDNHFYEPYMKQLIKLSNKNPRYPFAAMIIDNNTGTILCDGVNSSSNPTYHGEMLAIKHCLAKYPKYNWAKTTLITDAEPCAMCSGAIVWTNISKIVYGTSVTFFVKHGWNQINIRAESVIKGSPFYKGTVIGGILHQETDRLFAEAYSK